MIIQFLLILLLIVILFMLAKVYGYTEKNVTFAIPEHSIQWCVFGNPEKGNPVCNILDSKGKNMEDFSDFIEAFIDDRVIKSYEIK